MNLQNITTTYAADRIELFANEGRLVKGKWHSTASDGREIACLLGAIHGDINSPSECPAQVMPEWCASLIVVLFDGLPDDRVFDVGRDFAAALRKADGWPVAKWDDVRRKFLHATASRALESARSVADKLDDRGKAAFKLVQEACGDVLLTFAQGADPSSEQSAAAYAAADAAHAAYAANAAANAAYAAADAAYAAYAAAYAAADAAHAAYAANAAADAANAANAAYAAAYAAANAANAAYAAYSDLFAILIASINEAAQ